MEMNSYVVVMLSKHIQSFFELLECLPKLAPNVFPVRNETHKNRKYSLFEWCAKVISNYKNYIETIPFYIIFS